VYFFCSSTGNLTIPHAPVRPAQRCEYLVADSKIWVPLVLLLDHFGKPQGQFAKIIR
jgi:hypothetical protein